MPSRDLVSREGWTACCRYRPGTRVAGPAATIRYAPRRGVGQSSQSIYELIRTFEPGSVLVIESGGTRTSVFGGNMAAQGQVHGLPG